MHSTPHIWHTNRKPFYPLSLFWLTNFIIFTKNLYARHTHTQYVRTYTYRWLVTHSRYTRMHIIKPKSHKICISLYQSSIKFNCQPVNLFAAAVFLLPLLIFLVVCVCVLYAIRYLLVIYHFGFVLYFLRLLLFFLHFFFRNIVISKSFNRNGVTSYTHTHTHNIYMGAYTRNVIKHTHGHTATILKWIKKNGKNKILMVWGEGGRATTTRQASQLKRESLRKCWMLCFTGGAEGYEPRGVGVRELATKTQEKA